MSAYFTTHHFSPHWITPGAGESSSHQQQVHPPPLQPITTTITAPSIAPPESSAATATPSTSHRHLTLDTLARLLHDFHLANTKSSGDRDPVTHRSVARPHFDLLENKTTYAIYGELSGLSRQDVGVEVHDHLFTVTISGHLKRLVPLATTTTRPELGTAGEEDGVGVVHRDAAAASPPTTNEADNNSGKKHNAKGDEGTNKDATTETEKIPDDQKEVHWHVTERKVGEFRRAFQFPIDSVQMSGVTASMKDGLLCVLVPKRVREKREGGARKVEVV
ncbi:HSP20-like chaperone [Coniochaeta sp. 2T2.1]|nr:HSP20-like chaperone [Coniochaeta sp. 2T2.1]